MPKYNVQIEVTYKSYHEDDSIEAEDEAAAEEIAKENFWNDEYEDELRMNRENDDEQYDATEIIDKQTCPVCKKTYSEDNPDGNPINVGYEPVKEFNDSDKTIYTPQENAMSYMKHYAMWCQEQGYLDENFQSVNGFEDGMQHVDKYLKENPHMIPPDRTKDDKEKE